MRLLSNKSKDEAGIFPNSSFVLQHLDLQRHGGQTPLTHRAAPLALHLHPAWQEQLAVLGPPHPFIDSLLKYFQNVRTRLCGFHVQELVLALGATGHYMTREGDTVLQKLMCIRLDYEDSIIKCPDSFPAKYRNPPGSGSCLHLTVSRMPGVLPRTAWETAQWQWREAGYSPQEWRELSLPTQHRHLK